MNKAQQANKIRRFKPRRIRRFEVDRVHLVPKNTPFRKWLTGYLADIAAEMAERDFYTEAEKDV